MLTLERNRADDGYSLINRDGGDSFRLELSDHQISEHADLESAVNALLEGSYPALALSFDDILL